MIELRQFRHIVALAKYKNYRKAAQSVNITQPALSLSIKAAEEILGYKLFNKVEKTLTPTVFGEIVIEQGAKMIEEVENMQREMDLISIHEKGVLKISFSPYIHYSIGERFIEEFVKNHPSITLELIYGTWNNRIEMVKNKQVDLFVDAFVVDPERKIFQEPLLETIEVPIPPIVYFCRHGHPLASKEVVSYKDIANSNWSGEGGSPNYQSWIYQAVGMGSKKKKIYGIRKFYSSDYNSILNAVIHSNLLSAGSSVFFDQYEKKGLIKYLNIDWKVPHIESVGSIVYLKNRTSSEPVKLAISLIERILIDISESQVSV